MSNQPPNDVSRVRESQSAAAVPSPITRSAVMPTAPSYIYTTPTLPYYTPYSYYPPSHYVALNNMHPLITHTNYFVPATPSIVAPPPIPALPSYLSPERSLTRIPPITYTDVPVKLEGVSSTSSSTLHESKNILVVKDELSDGTTEKETKEKIISKRKIRRTMHKCTFDNCKYMTDRTSNLQNHIRTHTGEKPFRCNRCPFASGNISNLRHHIKRHERA